MAIPVFSVDGRTYNVAVPQGGLKRSASALDGSNAGRLMSGRMVRDLIGVYYNYSLTVNTKDLDVEEYDAMYQVITAPVDYHIITVPYGQSALTFQAYIANADDELLKMTRGWNRWGTLSFNFVAMEPQRTPG